MASSLNKDDAIIILVRHCPASSTTFQLTLNGVHQLSILLPPIAVIMMKRPTEDVLINIVLTLFGWILGIVHALYLLYKKKQSWL